MISISLKSDVKCSYFFPFYMLVEHNLADNTMTTKNKNINQLKDFYFSKSTGIFMSSKQWNHLILVLFHITK